MNRRELWKRIFGFAAVPSDEQTNYALATLPSGFAGELFHGAPGFVRHARLDLGLYNSKTDSRTFPTISVTDDGATGHGSLEILDLPRGVIHIWGAKVNIPFSIAGNWTITSPVMSIGTVAAAADATLTATEADIIGSTALTVTGSNPGTGTFSALAVRLGGLPSLTDNTGGTASATLAAITAPAANATTSLTADMTAVKNAIAQFAKMDNATPLPAFYDGSTTSGAAKKLFLNFAVNSDPTGAEIITLGNSTTRGSVDLFYSWLFDL